MSERLEAENTQLREEVERLRRIVYPPPPPPPKSKPERERLYLITVDTNEKMVPRVAPIMLGAVQRRIPEADWFVVHRVEDMPEDGVGVLLFQTLDQMWTGEDKEIRWYTRKGDKLQRRYTQAQLDQMGAEAKARMRQSDRLLDHTLRQKIGKRATREFWQQVNRDRMERRTCA